MPRNESHQVNPLDMEKWSNLPDHDNFYIVSPNNSVGTLAHYTSRTRDGATIHEAKPGDAIGEMTVLPAKAFGPGADLQRLVDLGAIRRAYPHEVDAAYGEVSEEDKIAIGADAAGKPRPNTVDFPDKAVLEGKDGEKPKADLQSKPK